MAVSTAMLSLSYKGTSSGATYTKIDGLKGIPSGINPQPSLIDASTFDDTEWKSYVNGLKDLGSAIGFTFNFTDTFVAAWAACVTASGGSAIDFKISFIAPSGVTAAPGFTKSFTFKGIPVALGVPSADVDAVFAGDAYIVPTKITGWSTT